MKAIKIYANDGNTIYTDLDGTVHYIAYDVASNTWSVS